MAKLVSDVLTSVRDTTQDVAARRAPDAELRRYVVDGLNAIKNERPDVFLGSWSEIETVANGDSLPVSAQFFRPLVDYVIARAESKEAEHVLSARVELMLKLAGGYLS